MRTPLAPIPLLALALTACAPGQKQGPEQWLTDFAAAQARAKAEGKDLLVNFTGSDWHTPSIKLWVEVLSKPAFVKGARKQFVLVSIDFPKVRGDMSEELVKQNDALMNRYGVAQLPTVLLLDNEGHPYEFLAYEEGGPEAYLESLHKRHRRGEPFKQALALAARKKGIDRAQTIDDALTSLGDEMRAKNLELMREVIKLDKDGKAGLRARYLQIVQLRDASALLEQMLAEHMEKGEGPEALAKLEAVIQKPKDTMQHQMALYLKGMLIMDTTRNVGDALAALDTAMTIAPTSPLAPKIRDARTNLKASVGPGK